MGIFRKDEKEKKMEQIENIIIEKLWRQIKKDKKNEKNITYIG